MINLELKENESELQYIWRLCNAKDSGILDMNWEELTEILNKNLREDETEYYGSSAYRKKYQQAKLFYEEVFSKMKPSSYTDEMILYKRDLEKAKIQFRDERNEWNKQNRIAARVEQKLDYLEGQLLQLGKKEYPNHKNVEINSDNDILVLLSDLHIGQTFESAWGEYNSDIAQERMDVLFEEILKIQKRHKSENINVAISGDLISGNIHSTIAISNRENVIEQVKIAADIITNFCYRLSENFNNVKVINVVGNHSRITRKDEAIHDERLDDLIGWIINKSLSNVENIVFDDNANIDSGIATFNIRDKEYVSVHGDYDKFSKSGVSNLCMMLGYIPYAILFGHLHTCAVDENNGVKMIRSGSFAGSGCDYTIEKRLSGRPSQMVCVCNDKGIEAYYTVELD